MEYQNQAVKPFALGWYSQSAVYTLSALFGSVITSFLVFLMMSCRMSLCGYSAILPGVNSGGPSDTFKT